MNRSNQMLSSVIATSVFVVVNFSSASIASMQARIGGNRTSETFTQNKQYGRGNWGGGQRGGGSRSFCGREVELTALVPEFKDSSGSSAVGGITVSEHPTLWFYISEPLDDQLVASFRLAQSDQELYRISSSEFSATQQTPGVIGITVPVFLEPNQLYYWTFQIECASGIYYVEGGIKRVLPEPTLATQLASLSPREQAKLYWQNGIWFDALTVIATHLNSAESMNSTAPTDWQQILQLIELSNIPAPVQPN